jgi:hypothetical protein
LKPRLASNPPTNHRAAAAATPATATKGTVMNKAIVDDLTKSSTETLTKISSDSTAAAQELAKAYQEVAARNLKNVMSALQALAAVKSPTAFVELQQKLIKDGMEDAMKDGQHIAKLTTAVFAAALEPMKHHMVAK